jgi:hypothetical protein
MPSIDTIAILLTFAVLFQILYLQISNAYYIFLISLPLDSPLILEKEAMEPGSNSKSASKRKAYIAKNDDNPSVESTHINPAGTKLTFPTSTASPVEANCRRTLQPHERQYSGHGKHTRMVKPKEIYIHWVPPPIPARVQHSSRIVKITVNEPSPEALPPGEPKAKTPSPERVVALAPGEPKAQAGTPARVSFSSSAVEHTLKKPPVPPVETKAGAPVDSRTLDRNETTTKDQSLICDEDIEPYAVDGIDSPPPPPEPASARKLPALATESTEDSEEEQETEMVEPSSKIKCIGKDARGNRFFTIPDEPDMYDCLFCANSEKQKGIASHYCFPAISGL